MATGQKITAQTPATSFDSGDLMTIVQSGANLSVDHDVLMDDTQVCKAWVNYNQVTPAITDSFNVSSVTDSSTGIFVINYTNNMDDANYSISGLGSISGTDTRNIAEHSTPRTVSACTIFTTDASDNLTDGTFSSVQIFGS